MELQFKNGSTATADIVIGSDGYRSQVRRHVTDEKARYSGATIIQGEIDHPESACPDFDRLLNRGNLMAMGNGATIAAQPRGDGGLTFYAASLFPERWLTTNTIDFRKPGEVTHFLKEHYKDWDKVFHSLFEACTNFVLRPLYYFPLEHPWPARANITLIGDAAHLMPPNGEGVNLAMQDALDLSECLTGTAYSDVESAIAAYEKIMFERAAPLCDEAVNGIGNFAAPDAKYVQELIEMFS